MLPRKYETSSPDLPSLSPRQDPPWGWQIPHAPQEAPPWGGPGPGESRGPDDWRAGVWGGILQEGPGLEGCHGGPILSGTEG